MWTKLHALLISFYIILMLWFALVVQYFYLFCLVFKKKRLKLICWYLSNENILRLLESLSAALDNERAVNGFVVPNRSVELLCLLFLSRHEVSQHLQLPHLDKEVAGYCMGTTPNLGWIHLNVLQLRISFSADHISESPIMQTLYHILYSVFYCPNTLCGSLPTTLQEWMVQYWRQ